MDICIGKHSPTKSKPKTLLSLFELLDKSLLNQLVIQSNNLPSKIFLNNNANILYKTQTSFIIIPLHKPYI